jgi:hypothetical protein
VSTRKVVTAKRKVRDEEVEGDSLAKESKRPQVLQLVQMIDIRVWRRHLLQWIVRKHVPFTVVEDDDFRAMLTTLSQSIELYLVTGDSIRRWISDTHRKAKNQVKEVIANALSKVHVSFDLWTSPNGIGICGICVQFVSPGLSTKLALAHRGPNASLNSSHNSTASMNNCAPERHFVNEKCGNSGSRGEGAGQQGQNIRIAL